ncbi:hypothetical protein LZ24_02549 [Desulfobotulus alkaliphilus]|uniref:Uncharacterized protein n=1 Tax=Desulfobotulus alkaliphilus TaxID=622671 RepID=A0A562RJK7_9BACT|nr:hypothetical protein [Desulfobotulus alkaliphilus]TWI68576.1 hypothetical protein LZ24_02549 [Desulfobotulus alkaliphilus]
MKTKDIAAKVSYLKRGFHSNGGNLHLRLLSPAPAYPVEEGVQREFSLSPCSGFFYGGHVQIGNPGNHVFGQALHTDYILCVVILDTWGSLETIWKTS